MRIRFPSVLLPWLFVPPLWALGFSWQVLPKLDLALPTAFLPLAILLGRNYGWRGAITVALGGFTLLLRIDFREWHVSSWFEPDLYVLSVAAASAAAGFFPWRRCLEFIRRRPLAWLIILLLPLHLVLGESQLFAGVSVRFGGDLYLVVWAAIILAGMSGVEWSVLLLPATALLAGFAASLGQALPWHAAQALGAHGVELPGLGVVSLQGIYGHYTLDSAAGLVTLFCCFGFGRWLARWRTDPGLPWPARWRARTLITLLAVVGAGGGIFRVLLEGFDFNADWLRLLPGNGTTGLLAALLAGFLLSRPGVVWVVVLAVIFAVLQVASPGLDILEEEQLLFELWRYVPGAVIFGWAGVELRKTLGVPTPVRTSLHFKYFAAISLAIVSLVPEQHWNEDITPSEVWLLLTGALIVLSIVLRIWWQRRSRAVSSLESEYEGWLALAALIAAGVVIAENIGKIREELASLRQLPETIRAFHESGMNETGYAVLAVAAVALSALWAALTTLQTAWEKLHSCWRDARRALARLSAFFGLARLAAWLALPEPPVPNPKPSDRADDSPPKGKAPWFARCTGYAAQTALVLLFGLGVFSAATALFPDGWPESDDHDEPAATAPDAPPQPNPHLWQAAKEFTAALPIEKSDAAAYPATLTTRWRYDAPQTRRERYEIRVSEHLDYGLEVNFTVQEHRHSLWFAGLDKFSAQEYAERQRASDGIRRRARELAAKAVPPARPP